MEILDILNSFPLYALCGGIIAFIAVVCIVFMIRAYKVGIATGMDKRKLKRTITSSAIFSVLPSIGILLGVIALSGSLGIPWPWLRLSVIGALHYETQIAQAAAEQVGLSTLSASEMTVSAFTTIALLMSIGMMWGMLLNIFFNKKYTRSLGSLKNNLKKKKSLGFADSAMTAMFIGLVIAYLGSYIGSFVSINGLFTFSGKIVPIIVMAVSAFVMAVFIFLSLRCNASWIDNFSVAASMLAGMTVAALIK